MESVLEAKNNRGAIYLISGKWVHIELVGRIRGRQPFIRLQELE